MFILYNTTICNGFCLCVFRMWKMVGKSHCHMTGCRQYLLMLLVTAFDCSLINSKEQEIPRFPVAEGKILSDLLMVEFSS